MIDALTRLPETRRVLREQELARMLGIHVQTIRRWRRAGTGPKCIRLGPKLWGYVMEDLVAWQESQRARRVA